MIKRTDDAQAMALRAFVLLCALAPEWQGRLVMRAGLEEQGTALSRAAVIAGGACLAIDSRPEACRAALREGACDFVVNTTDEALRILKNEIRKRQPVSVALAMTEAAALAELTDRGVAPEILSFPLAPTLDSIATKLGRFGTRIVADSAAQGLVNNFSHSQKLTLREFRFTTAQELSAFDRRLAEATAQSGLRSRWAAAAPRLFYRDRPFRRLAFLTPAELTAVQSEASS
jgi:hypothetical protein